MLNLGNLIITESIINAIENETLTNADITQVIERYRVCDWGDLCLEDKAVNNYAFCNNGRILSSYFIKGVRIWITTENFRRETWVFLTGGY